MNSPSVEELRAAAIRYANRGIPVLPCAEGGKKPVVQEWTKKSTVDIDTIQKWWAVNPYNVGIATGHGIVVLDVDIKHHEGKYGDETLQELEKEHGPLPDTWEVITGGGGRHLYFKCDDPDLGNRVRFAPDLDFRGKDGVVIAPPSVHANGNRYVWEAAHEPRDTDLAPLPDWLHDLILKANKTTEKAKKEVPQYIRAGERNDTLFRLACSFRSKGLTENEILPAMLEINYQRCDPPLPDREVKSICESAGKYPVEVQLGENVKKEKLSLQSMNSWLESHQIKIRKNVIAHTFECTGVENLGDYDSETVENHLDTIIFDAISKEYSCTQNRVTDFLPVIAGKNRFNPVLDTLAATPPWDGKDRFPEIYSILNIAENDDLSRTLVHKYFWQCLAMVKNELKSAYGADGLLVLQGPQGIGKTSFCRKIAIKEEFVKLGQYVDAKNRDVVRRTTSCFITELGEVETTFRHDLDSLKNFITRGIDEYRLPYGRKDERVPRRTSLIATCNSEQFLIDVTGNRRFWTVPVTDIDLPALDKLDIIQVWKQVEAETRDNPQGFRLTKEEVTALKARNTNHEKPVKAQDEIEDIFADAEENPEKYHLEYITVSVFKSLYSTLSRFDSRQIGQALKKLGYEDKQKRIDGKPARVRELPVPSDIPIGKPIQ